MKVEIITEKIPAGWLLLVNGDVDMNTSPDVPMTHCMFLWMRASTSRNSGVR